MGSLTLCLTLALPGSELTTLVIVAIRPYHAKPHAYNWIHPYPTGINCLTGMATGVPYCFGFLLQMATPQGAPALSEAKA